MHYPQAIWLDSGGNLFLSDQNDYAVRRVDATGEGRMKFVFRQWIDAPREVVFAFFRNPRCLPLKT